MVDKEEPGMSISTTIRSKNGMTLEKNFVFRGCATRGELIKVVELLDRAFANTSREYFERHVLNDPTLRPEHTRIIEYGGNIVCSVQIFPRLMNLGVTEALFGGIGNVATDPSMRHAGLGSSIMQDALKWMTAQGYVFSMLSTSINLYYERFGFKTVVRTAHTLAEIQGVRDSSVRLFDEQRDLDSLKKIYQEYNESSVGTLRRDDIYWQAQLGFSGEDRNSFLVQETDGKVSAYLRATQRKGKLLVLEFGANRDPAGSFERLLCDLAARNSHRPIEFFLSEYEKQRIRFRLKSTAHDDRELMVCPLDHSAAASACSMLLEFNNCCFWMSDFF